MTALSRNRTVQLDRSFSLLDDLSSLTDNLIRLLGCVYRFRDSLVVGRDRPELSRDCASALLDYVVPLSWRT